MDSCYHLLKGLWLKVKTWYSVSVVLYDNNFMCYSKNAIHLPCIQCNGTTIGFANQSAAVTAGSSSTQKCTH